MQNIGVKNVRAVQKREDNTITENCIWEYVEEWNGEVNNERKSREEEKCKVKRKKKKQEEDLGMKV